MLTFKRQDNTSASIFYNDEDFKFEVPKEENLLFENALYTLKGAFITANYESLQEFEKMSFSKKLEEMKNEPNAGGSSLQSEVRSAHLFLWWLEGATFYQMELEIEYKDKKSPKVDYTCKLGGVIMGVSVTGITKYERNMGTLLEKKLKKLLAAGKNAPEEWQILILHIWADKMETAKNIRRMYEKIEDIDLSKIIVIVTVVVGPDVDWFGTPQIYQVAPTTNRGAGLWSLFILIHKIYKVIRRFFDLCRLPSIEEISFKLFVFVIEELVKCPYRIDKIIISLLSFLFDL